MLFVFFFFYLSSSHRTPSNPNVFRSLQLETLATLTRFRVAAAPRIRAPQPLRPSHGSVASDVPVSFYGPLVRDEESSKEPTLAQRGALGSAEGVNSRMDLGAFSRFLRGGAVLSNARVGRRRSGAAAEIAGKADGWVARLYETALVDSIRTIIQILHGRPLLPELDRMALGRNASNLTRESRALHKLGRLLSNTLALKQLQPRQPPTSLLSDNSTTNDDSQQQWSVEAAEEAKMQEALVAFTFGGRVQHVVDGWTAVVRTERVLVLASSITAFVAAAAYSLWQLSAIVSAPRSSGLLSPPPSPLFPRTRDEPGDHVTLTGITEFEQERPEGEVASSESSSPLASLSTFSTFVAGSWARVLWLWSGCAQRKRRDDGSTSGCFSFRRGTNEGPEAHKQRMICRWLVDACRFLGLQCCGCLRKSKRVSAHLCALFMCSNLSALLLFLPLSASALLLLLLRWYHSDLDTFHGRQRLLSLLVCQSAPSSGWEEVWANTSGTVVLCPAGSMAMGQSGARFQNMFPRRVTETHPHTCNIIGGIEPQLPLGAIFVGCVLMLFSQCLLLVAMVHCLGRPLHARAQDARDPSDDEAHPVSLSRIRSCARKPVTIVKPIRRMHLPTLSHMHASTVVEELRRERRERGGSRGGCVRWAATLAGRTGPSLFLRLRWWPCEWDCGR